MAFFLSSGLRPWLRPDKDPRIPQPAPAEAQGSFRIFNELSRQSCDLRSLRAQLLVARRKCMPGRDRQLLDEDLREINRRINRIDSAFKPPINASPEHKDCRIVVLDHEGGYYFAGRQLPFSHIKPTIFSCDACAQRVWSEYHNQTVGLHQLRWQIDAASRNYRLLPL
jgi:hypothetical protein